MTEFVTEEEFEELRAATKELAGFIRDVNSRLGELAQVQKSWLATSMASTQGQITAVTALSTSLAVMFMDRGASSEDVKYALERARKMLPPDISEDAHAVIDGALRCIPPD